MEGKQVLKSLAKSTNISVVLVTLGIGISVMMTFFLCFIQEESYELPLALAKITTEYVGDGYITTIQLGNEILHVAIIGFLVLTALLFVLFYFQGRAKSQKS